MKIKESEPSSVEKKAHHSWGGFIAFIIVIIAIGLAIYFYSENKKSQALLKNPNQAVEEETKTLIAKVGMLMELPTNEQPTLATVSDKTKLADQPFFRNAKNGDKVLIYTKNKKAILYRPSINKIIEVAPINIADTQPTQPPVPTEVVPTIKTKITPTTKLSPTKKVTPTEEITESPDEK